MAKSNGFGIVKSLRIGQSNAAKSPRGEMFNDYNRDYGNIEGIVYSPNKYRETEGINANVFSTGTTIRW